MSPAAILLLGIADRHDLVEVVELAERVLARRRTSRSSRSPAVLAMKLEDEKPELGADSVEIGHSEPYSGELTSGIDAAHEAFVEIPQAEDPKLVRTCRYGYPVIDCAHRKGRA
jgi:hypothetical protein